MSGRLLERVLDPGAPQTEPRLLLDVVARRLRGRVERLGPARLLAADEVDRAPVDQREDPGAGLRALGDEARRRAPDGDEALLHGVLGERGIAHDPEGEPVGDPAETVVQLRQRVFVGAGDEGDERLVREMSEPAGHERVVATRTRQR